MRKFFITVVLGYLFIGLALFGFFQASKSGNTQKPEEPLNKSDVVPSSPKTQGGVEGGKGKSVRSGPLKVRSKIKMKEYPSGRLVSLYDGKFRTIYKTGQISSEWGFKEGELDGVNRFYYESGRIWIESVYAKGVQTDISKTYYPNGSLQSETDYLRGRQDPKAVFYYDSGVPWVEISYAQGLIVGPPKLYSENGELRTPLSVLARSGKGSDPNGIFRAYDERGAVKAEWQEAGTGETVIETYYRSGRVSSRWKLNGVQISGTAELYYPTGDIWREIPFEKGQAHGLEKIYYPGGKKILGHIVYANNQPHGLKRLMYPDGSLWVDITYSEGRMVGPPRAYSQGKQNPVNQSKG